MGAVFWVCFLFTCACRVLGFRVWTLALTALPVWVVFYFVTGCAGMFVVCPLMLLACPVMLGACRVMLTACEYKRNLATWHAAPVLFSSSWTLFFSKVVVFRFALRVFGCVSSCCSFLGWFPHCGWLSFPHEWLSF